MVWGRRKERCRPAYDVKVVRLDVVADGGHGNPRAMERLGGVLGLEERPFPNSSVMNRKYFLGSSARPSPINQSYPSLWAR